MLRSGFFPRNTIGDGPAFWIFQDSWIRVKDAQNRKREFHSMKALIRIFKYLQIDRCKVIQVYSYLNSSSKLVTNTLAGDLKTREILGELFQPVFQRK